MKPNGDIQFRDARGIMRSLASELVSNFLGVPYHGQNKETVRSLHLANFEILKQQGKL